MNRTEYLELRNRFVSEERNAELFSVLALNFLLLASCVSIWGKFSGSWERFLSIPLLSVFMFRNFSLMHEAVHGVASRNRFVNDAVGVVSAGICMLFFEPWKSAHLEHHLWGGNIDRDPVMAMVRIFPHWPKPVRALFSWAWRAWVPVLSFLQHTVFWAISVKYFFQKPKSALAFASVVFPLLLWGGLAFFLSGKILWGVVAPAAALYLIFTEVVNAPHHLGLRYVRGEERLPVWEQFRIARTCIYPEWLSRVVVLNFNYHVEHHMFPNARWNQLPEIHRALRDRLGEQYNQDPQFAWVRVNRTRNLVDVVKPLPDEQAIKAA